MTRNKYDFGDAHKALEYLHVDKELSHRAIAARVGCARETIWRIANGRTAPSGAVRKGLTRVAREIWNQDKRTAGLRNSKRKKRRAA